jgi:2-polyprenyl-3-methyl-5-hydroxy-6-metoxy-1,4-benzoquinol methylase
MGKIKGAFAKTYDSFIKRPNLLPAGLLELIRSKNARSVVDFGCGTGNIAIGLALEGYDVTGVDYSTDMLKIAQAKAKEIKSDVKFVCGDIIRVNLKRSYDVLLCTGNTIALICNKKDIKRLLDNCKRHLAPGGHIIFQQLNYDRMLKNGSGTFAVESGSDGIIRIKQNRFNRIKSEFFVTIIDSHKIPPIISTNRGIIRPWLKTDLIGLLRDAGFTHIHPRGNYDGEAFGSKSTDLILIATIKKGS